MFLFAPTQLFFSFVEKQQQQKFQQQKVTMKSSTHWEKKLNDFGTSWNSSIWWTVERQVEKSTWSSLERVGNCRFDGPSNVKLKSRFDRVWNELEIVDLMHFRTSSWKLNLNDFGTNWKLSIWWTFERQVEKSTWSSLERVGNCRFDVLSIVKLKSQLERPSNEPRTHRFWTASERLVRNFSIEHPKILTSAYNLLKIHFSSPIFPFYLL